MLHWKYKIENMMVANDQYNVWISEISRRFRSSQIKATVKVNSEMLHFYWQLGKELHEKKRVFFLWSSLL